MDSAVSAVGSVEILRAQAALTLDGFNARTPSDVVRACTEWDLRAALASAGAESRDAAAHAWGGPSLAYVLLASTAYEVAHEGRSFRAPEAEPVDVDAFLRLVRGGA